MQTTICYQCNKETGLEAKSTIFRSTECPHCMNDMRCCKMCNFFEDGSYNQCREPLADRITEKEKANFCDFFELSGSNRNTINKQNPISAAEALFKK